MIKLENTEVVGWEAAIRGMRNPMNSWEKSDTCFRICRTGFHEDRPCNPECANPNCNGPYINKEIGPNDLDLMKHLANGGPVHAKYRRMIVVYVDITAPLYWWKEFDTYKVGTVANSCSTMHKIHDKEFTLEDFSCEHMPQKWILEDIINELNKAREYFNKYDQLDDGFKSDYSKKDFWWQMIQLLPSSYNQKRTVMMNYEVLANIYEWRKEHKLDEWRDLCKWIEELPYHEIICGPDFLRKKMNIPEDNSNAKEFTPQEYAKNNPEWSKKIEDIAYNGLL